MSNGPQHPSDGRDPEGQRRWGQQPPDAPGASQSQWGKPQPTPQPQWGQQPSGASQPQWGQPHNPPVQQPQWGQPQPQWGGSQQWGQQPSWGQPPGPAGYAAPPKPGVIPLRPLGVGEILDGAFQATRKNAKAMFGSAILFQLAVAILMALATGAFFGAGTNVESFIQPNGVPTAAGISFGAGIFTVFLLLALLNSFSVFVLQGVLVVPVSRAILNQHTTFKEMWSRAKGRIWPLIGLCALWLFVGGPLFLAALVLLIVLGVGVELNGWIIFLLAFAMVVAAIWVGIKIMLAPAALVLEETGVFASIGRSWRLVRRNWWRIFGITLLTFVIVGIVTSVVTVPIQLIVSFFGMGTAETGSAESMLMSTLIISLVSTIVSSVFYAVAYAFQAGVTALMYVDLRMRHEGFDIVLMKESERLAAVAGAPGPAYPPGQGY